MVDRCILERTRRKMSAVFSKVGHKSLQMVRSYRRVWADWTDSLPPEWNVSFLKRLRLSLLLNRYKYFGRQSRHLPEFESLSLQ